MFQPLKVKPLCPPESAPRFEDVPYGEVTLDNGEAYTLKMDIYQDPSQTSPGPCIVYIFGGGWSWGEYKQTTQKAVYCRDLVRLTKEGYTVVCPDYRLIHQSLFPACVHDVKGAIRFLKANGAKYNIDPERIGAVGNSAGGHLAAMLALSANQPDLEGTVGGNTEFDSSVKAACLFYAAYDLPASVLDTCASLKEPPKDLSGTEVDHLSNDNADAILALAVGFTGPGKNIKALGDLIKSQDKSNPDWHYVELLEKLSPIKYVREDLPQLCLFHGGYDPLVNPTQTENMYHALRQADADVTMVCKTYAGHGPSMGTLLDNLAYDFLRTHL